MREKEINENKQHICILCKIYQHVVCSNKHFSIRNSNISNQYWKDQNNKQPQGSMKIIKQVRSLAPMLDVLYLVWLHFSLPLKDVNIICSLNFYLSTINLNGLGYRDIFIFFCKTWSTLKQLWGLKVQLFIEKGLTNGKTSCTSYDISYQSKRKCLELEFVISMWTHLTYLITSLCSEGRLSLHKSLLLIHCIFFFIMSIKTFWVYNLCNCTCTCR